MRMLAMAAAAVGLVVAAMGPPAAGGPGGARVGQPAPEITGAPWINSAPLSMEGLRGRVVFVEFWTYG